MTETFDPPGSAEIFRAEEVATKNSPAKEGAIEPGAHEDRISPLMALREAYWLVYHAWSNERFGSGNSDEAKEMRREMAEILARAGIRNPAFPDATTEGD